MTLNPSQMYESFLDPIKGWFTDHALDYQAKLDAAVTYRVPAGRVLSLKANGNFETGISGTKMAIFNAQNSDAFDVSNPGFTSRGNFMHYAVSPTGVMNGLVATGGYELSSTEFDTTRTYTPNQLLTALGHNTDVTKGGVLCNDRGGVGVTTGVVRQYTDAACGVVSGGRKANEYGIPTLEFWPIYLPAAAA